MSRIVGGTEAAPHSIPWQVSIGYYDDYGKLQHYCGGVILNKQYVLSAAHCAITSSWPVPHNGTWKMPTYVAVKEHNRTDDSDGQHIIEICNWKTHKSYDPYKFRFDFALATLKQPIAFDDKAIPACLPSPRKMRQDDFFAGKALIVSGWGKLGFDLGPSDVLMKLDVTAQSNEDCNKFWPVGNISTSLLYPEMICADGKREKPEQTVCMGDSGGPLTYTDQEGVTVVVGVTSFGRRNVTTSEACIPGYPAVFARVTSVLDWITDEIQKDIGPC